MIELLCKPCKWKQKVVHSDLATVMVDWALKTIVLRFSRPTCVVYILCFSRPTCIYCLHFVFFQANFCLLSTFCVFPGQLVFIVYILCFSRPTCVYSLSTFCVFPGQLVFILFTLFFQANLCLLSTFYVFPGQLACLLSVYILCFSRPTCVYSVYILCFSIGVPFKHNNCNDISYAGLVV